MTARPADSRVHAAIGRNMVARRAALGRTQADVAAAIGMARTTVTNIEAGRHQLKVATLVAIAAALNTTIEALIGVATAGRPETQTEFVVYWGGPDPDTATGLLAYGSISEAQEVHALMPTAELAWRTWTATPWTLQADIPPLTAAQLADIEANAAARAELLTGSSRPSPPSSRSA